MKHSYFRLSQHRTAPLATLMIALAGCKEPAPRAAGTFEGVADTRVMVHASNRTLDKKLPGLRVSVAWSAGDRVARVVELEGGPFKAPCRLTPHGDDGKRPAIGVDVSAVPPQTCRVSVDDVSEDLVMSGAFMSTGDNRLDVHLQNMTTNDHGRFTFNLQSEMMRATN